MQHRKGMAEGCLDDETLAAYVDGGLTAEERTQVEQHLASCRDCFAVFTETVKTVQAMGKAGEIDLPPADSGVPSGEAAAVVPIAARPPRRVVQWAAAGAGLAAAAALVFAVWWPKAERPELVDLVAAVGARRPVEGRLTGGFKFGPIESPTRGTEASTDWRVLAAAGKLEEEARGTENARLLGALGTAHLVTRDFDSAVKYYDQAIDLAPDDPLLRTDRAAALLARGDAAGDGGAADFVRALDDAARAVIKDPARPEALFNKAVALQRMHLEDQELEAWRAYLALDPTSPWAAEARTRIAAIESARKSRSRWEEHRESVLAAADRGDRARVDVAAKEFAENVRALVEDEVLPSWGEAVLRGDGAGAAALLVRARVLAASVAAVNSDPLALDAVNAASSDPRVSAGYAAWGLGRRLYADDRIGDARTEFDRARALLGLENAIGLAADLYVQIARFIAREYEATGPEFDRIAGAAAARGYWHALGSAERMRGLAHGFRGEFDRSLSRHEASLACFVRTGDQSGQLAADSAVAEMFEFLGRPVDAWRRRLAALSREPHRTALRRRHTALVGAAAMARRHERFGAALALQNAAVRVAREWGLAGAVAEAEQALSAISLEAGDSAGALRHAYEARTLASEIPDRDSKARSVAEVDAAMGAALVSTDPERAVRLLTGAIEYWQQSGGRARLPFLYLTRGAASRALGEFERARSDLEYGLVELSQSTREGEPRPGMSVWDLHLGEALLSELVAIIALDQHRPVEAYAVLERLREGRWRGFAASTDLDAEANHLIGQLPPETAGISYLVLRRQLVAWAISARGIAFVPLGPATRLIQLSRRVSGGVRSGQLAPELLADLYDVLIRPLPLAGATRLVAVLPAGLHVFPFAAFLDSSTGRYLVEDVEVSASPSVTHYVRAWQRHRNRPIPTRALSVHASAGGARWRRLPLASREAAAVAGIYPSATLVAGHQLRADSFGNLLQQSEIVHFAGHAVANPTFPALSFLLLSDDAVDGPSVVFARDLASSHLENLQVVVLAACGTSSTDMDTSRPLSLGTAFLDARAQSVISAQWTLLDSVSDSLLPNVHRAIRQGATGAQALRLAQLDAIERRTLKPAQWGGLIAMGL